MQHHGQVYMLGLNSSNYCCCRLIASLLLDSCHALDLLSIILIVSKVYTNPDFVEVSGKMSWPSTIALVIFFLCVQPKSRVGRSMSAWQCIARRISFAWSQWIDNNFSDQTSFVWLTSPSVMFRIKLVRFSRESKKLDLLHAARVVTRSSRAKALLCDFHKR